MSTSKINILISDPLGERAIKLLSKEKAFKVDVKTGLAPAALKKIIGNYDAVIVRSGTTLTKDIIEKAKRLKAIGRAGVGFDNVDLTTATKNGVIVMNTPASNTLSTAEHTMSMLLAMSRNIPQACASLRSGEWKRSKFVGTETAGKTLGIIGFGRIGKEVAKRALSFEMKVIAFDPFLSPDAIRQPGVEGVANVKEVFKQADYITVHVPLNDDTRSLIGKEEFKIMKKGVRIINCARGGIVNEKDLAEAVKSGKVRGAALDVFEQEPPDMNHPLFKLSEVVVTPHLGASTEEAQEGVSVTIAEQIADTLLGRGTRNAVNLPNMDSETYKIMEPWLNLAEKLGLFYTQLFEGQIKEVDVRYSGEVTDYALAPLTIALLKGLLYPISGDIVNFVNAPTLARERGIVVNESKSTELGDFANAISLTVKSSKGSNIIVGSLFGNRDPRIVRVNEFHLDAIPTGTMIVIKNIDKPGMVGSLGTLLGKKKINIAEMTIGREKKRRHSITVVNTDHNVTPVLLKQIKALKHIVDAKVVKL